MQRLSPGRARDHPVMDIVPNNALSLSLSLSLSGLVPVPSRRGEGRGDRERKSRWPGVTVSGLVDL